MATEPRPLLAAIEERELEESTRRRMTAERCEAMEKALRAIGFECGGVHWTVAVFIARVAGWQPLRRTLSEIANDESVATNATKQRDRKSAVRRALDSLAEIGVLQWHTEPVATIRGRQREYAAVVELDRAAILRLADGRNLEVATPEPATAAARNDHATSEVDGEVKGEVKGEVDGEVKGEVKGEVARVVSSYPLITPIPPSPPSEIASDWEAVAAFLKVGGFVSAPSALVIREAEAAGMSPSDLADLGKQTKAAGLGGGAVLKAIRDGYWPELVATHRATRRPAVRAPRPSAEQIRISTTKRVRRETGRPLAMDAPECLAAIARALTSCGLGDEMTAEERAALRELAAT